MASRKVVFNTSSTSECLHLLRNRWRELDGFERKKALVYVAKTFYRSTLWQKKVADLSNLFSDVVRIGGNKIIANSSANSNLSNPSSKTTCDHARLRNMLLESVSLDLEGINISESTFNSRDVARIVFSCGILANENPKISEMLVMKFFEDFTRDFREGKFKKESKHFQIDEHFLLISGMNEQDFSDTMLGLAKLRHFTFDPSTIDHIVNAVVWAFMKRRTGNTQWPNHRIPHVLWSASRFPDCVQLQKLLIQDLPTHLDLQRLKPALFAQACVGITQALNNEWVLEHLSRLKGNGTAQNSFTSLSPLDVIDLAFEKKWPNSFGGQAQLDLVIALADLIELGGQGRLSWSKAQRLFAEKLRHFVQAGSMWILAGPKHVQRNGGDGPPGAESAPSTDSVRTYSRRNIALVCALTRLDSAFRNSQIAQEEHNFRIPQMEELLFTIVKNHEAHNSVEFTIKESLALAQGLTEIVSHRKRSDENIAVRKHLDLREIHYSVFQLLQNPLQNIEQLDIRESLQLLLICCKNNLHAAQVPRIKDVFRNTLLEKIPAHQLSLLCWAAAKLECHDLTELFTRGFEEVVLGSVFEGTMTKGMPTNINLENSVRILYAAALVQFQNKKLWEEAIPRFFKAVNFDKYVDSNAALRRVSHEQLFVTAWYGWQALGIREQCMLDFMLNATRKGQKSEASIDTQPTESRFHGEVAHTLETSLGKTVLQEVGHVGIDLVVAG